MPENNLPEDYIDQYMRGTVNYDPSIKNYSFNKVFIENDTIIESSNFSQSEPRTEAIINGKNLTFINCNLVNVLIAESWILKNCLTAQSWIVPLKNPDNNNILDNEGNILQDRQYITDHPDNIDEQNIILPDEVILSIGTKY